MFFIITRRITLALKPRDFGKNMKTKIFEELKSKVEGKVSGAYGYTILVTQLERVGDGLLNEDTGDAHFEVDFTALVLRPFEGEIIPAEVKSISKQGFFCQAGPLEIFVSSHTMPEEFEFDTSTGNPSFVARDHSEEEDENDDIRISIGTMCRIRLIGLRFAADSIVK